MRINQWYDTLQRICQRIWRRPKFAWIVGLLIICLLFVRIDEMLHSRVTLRFVVPNGEASQWQALIDQFEKTESNIDIDLVNLRDQNAIKPQDPRAVKKLYIDSFKSREKPFYDPMRYINLFTNREKQFYDLVFMDVIWVPEFAEKRWIRELSLRPSDIEKDFLIDDVKGGTYHDKLYRMPVRSDMGWLYYRTDLLKDAGLQPPETFDQLIDIAQKLQKSQKAGKQEFWGYLWQGRQAESIAAMFVEVLHGYGGFWIKPESLEVGLDRPEAVKAVQFLHDTMFKHRISPTTLLSQREDETLKSFLEGNAAFLRHWSYVLTRANLTDVDSDIHNEIRNQIRNHVGVKPMLHQPGYSSAGCQGGWGLGIARKTQHPEEAWKAVKFFSTMEAQRKLFLSAGNGLPTQRELFHDPQLVKRYGHYPAFLDFIENQKQPVENQKSPIVFRPSISQYAQATCILQKYLRTALTQEKPNPSIENQMKDAANDTRILLKLLKGDLKEKDCID